MWLSPRTAQIFQQTKPTSEVTWTDIGVFIAVALALIVSFVSLILSYRRSGLVRWTRIFGQLVK